MFGVYAFPSNPENWVLYSAVPLQHAHNLVADSRYVQALSFMLQNLGKPVILTGSQAPMLELQNDAEGNLLNSLIIAGHFMIPEVCLFFNHSLFRGNRTTKVSASDFAAFASPNLPPLATISSQKTHVSVLFLVLLRCNSSTPCSEDSAVWIRTGRY